MSFGEQFRRFVRSFGYTGVRAAGVTARIAGEGSHILQPDEVNELNHLNDLVRSGRELTAAQYLQAAALLRRLAPRHTPRTLVTQDGSAFTVPSLMQIFEQEVAPPATARN
jgi:hypothetical protein